MLKKFTALTEGFWYQEKKSKHSGSGKKLLSPFVLPNLIRSKICTNTVVEPHLSGPSALFAQYGLNRGSSLKI